MGAPTIGITHDLDYELKKSMAVFLCFEKSSSPNDFLILGIELLKFKIYKRFYLPYNSKKAICPGANQPSGGCMYSPFLTSKRSLTALSRSLLTIK